jgi:hypothetical protein
MDYKQLLGHLEDMTLASGIQEFDSREVSLHIITKFVTRNFDRDVAMATKNSVKRVSNDLNRLYRMQLLSRKRVKRTCEANRLVDDGRKCSRGFMFKYSFTRQGLRYITYLKTKKNEVAVEKAFRLQNDLIKDLDMMVSMKAMRQHLPKSLHLIDWKFALFIREITDSETQFKGRYHRFPPSIDNLLMFVIMRFINESKKKDEKIRLLEAELHKTHESIRQERLGYTALLDAANDRLDRLSLGERF